MKQLTCEMCGSTDLIKQDGVFVCQSCGCKYSIEEAKKIMVEGTVDVQGTVKVDNSEFVQKCLTNARRAKEKEDWEETEKYYNMVEQNDPQKIEAIFYSSYGKAKSSLVDGDLYKRQAAFKVLQNCVSLIDDNYIVDRETENKLILEQISQDIVLMACSSYVYNQKKNGYGIVVWTDKMETVTLFNNLGREFMVACEHIAQKYPDDKKSKRVYFYKLALKHAEFVLKNGCLANQEGFQTLVNTYNGWIAKITTEYAQKAKDQYWADHTDEKAALENEKARLQSSLGDFNAEMDNIAGMSDKKYFEDKIVGLKKQLASLGLFKSKEKKALQAQIEGFDTKLNDVNASMRPSIDAIDTKIANAKKRISEIDVEFAKDRM